VKAAIGVAATDKEHMMNARTRAKLVGAAIAVVAVPTLLLLCADTAHATLAVSEPGTWMVTENPTPIDCGPCGWLTPQFERPMVGDAEETGWFGD
jgi:hypothetical protein